jgi:hypothetical protein
MATPASAYPRLSPSGGRVVAGDRTLVVDQSIEIGPGIAGQWRDDVSLVYGGHDGKLWLWKDAQSTVLRAQGFNVFVVAGARWIGWRPDTGLVWHDEVVWPDWHSPALSETRWAAILGTTLYAGLGDGQAGQPVASHARDPRLVGNVLTWVQDEADGAMSVWGQRFHGGLPERLSIPGNTRQGYIVPVVVNGQPWALTHDDVRVMLYPWGTYEGYPIADAPAHRPDGRPLPQGPVRCVWDAEHNVLGETVIDTRTALRVDLRTVLAPQPERIPEGTEIDVLPFLVGEASTWPRNGDHYMHQSWDGRNLHWMKFGPVSESSTFCDAWERLVLDGDQFYLREDRSQSGAGIYSFHPGTWLKRRMRVGEYVDVPENILQRYEKGSCRVIDQHPLPYRVGLVEAWKHFDCGPSLGIRDVIKVDYDPGSDRDTQEFQSHARDAGWFQFQERRQDGTNASHTTRFHIIGGQALTPTQGCWRRDLVPWPPSTPKPPDPKPPTPPAPTPEPVMSEVSLQTFNRSNWIVAEDGGGNEGETTHGRPRGLARADRTAPGPWETFTFKRSAEGRVGFRAPNGGWLSAQPDGTLVFNRHRPDDWQPGAWEAFGVEGALEGGISLVTDHGTRVRAVNAGGSELRHDVRESAGIDETFFPSVSITTGGGTAGGSHPVGGGSGVPGWLRVAGRWFASPAGLFDYREVSAFALYSLWLQKRFGEVDAFLSAMAPYATAARVVLTLDGDFWAGRGYRCAPDMAGFYEELRPFAAHCESRGFYVRFCLVGAIEPFGGVWFPDRRDIWTPDLDARVRAYIEQVMPRISDAPNALTEGANEPGQIGLRSSFDKVKGWGRLVKRLAPHLLHNFAAVDGPNDGDTSFIEAPADFVDAHIHRMKEYRSGDGWNGWLWVKRSSEHAIFDNEEMPAISGETINFGSVGTGGHGDVEASPAIAFAYGATSRLRRYLTNFHFDDGLWCRPPNAETVACLDGWKRGLDAIPVDFGGGWCNGHHGCSPWETSNFPTSDEVRDHNGPVRIFGRSGGAGYIGASIREVVGHRPRSRRPVEEIARVEWGGYASAIYRA